ncbi:MAG: hypothetical protein V4565_05405 [Bacteroidota bacterium]
MELTIGAWYNEPGVSFDFSFRISKFVRLAIKECIMTPLGLIDAYPEKCLHLTVTTTSAQDKLEVKMGPFKSKATNVNCGLWFPYNSIILSKNPLEEYIENYIKSIPLVFEKWGVTAEQISQVTIKIKTEIIGNPYYFLTDQEQKELEEEKQENKEFLQRKQEDE